jgi:hypothetical protein
LQRRGETGRRHRAQSLAPTLEILRKAAAATPGLDVRFTDLVDAKA